MKNIRHSRESGNPGRKLVFKEMFKDWMPAAASMTTRFFLIFTLIFYGFPPQPAQAAEVRIDGNWLLGKPPPYLLTDPNTTYLLDQDIMVDGTAFIVGAANVTLDLNGHTITYGNAAPIIVTNGNFAKGTGSSVPGWDLSAAPGAALAPNTFYLPGGSQCLQFSNMSGPNTILSDAISIPTANREYVATVATRGGGTGQLSVVDAVTGDVLAVSAEFTLKDGAGLVLSFTPTTTHDIYIKMVVTPTSSSTVGELANFTLTPSRDYGIAVTHASWYFPPHLKTDAITKAISSATGNATIKNGSIIQGQSRGYASYPVFAKGMNTLTVDDITSSANGIDTDSVGAMYSNHVTIRNSIFTNDIPWITNRMAYGTVIQATSANNLLVEGNTMYDNPHVGVWADHASGVVIRNNTMYPNMLVTNGYGVLFDAVDNFEISGNTIYAGVGKSGLGIMLDNWNTNGTVFGNNVDVRAKPNAEYGEGHSWVGMPAAFRIRSGGDAGVQNVSVHDNNFTARGGPGYWPGANGGKLTFGALPSAPGDLNIRIYHNTFTGITDDPVSHFDFYARGLEVSGWGALVDETPFETGLRVYDNEFISNDVSLGLGGSYGPGHAYGINFISNKFIKSTEGAALSYASIKASGISAVSAHGITLIDNQYESGQTFPDIRWFGTLTKDISIGWLLSVAVKAGVNPLCNALVQVSDKNGAVVFSGQTNAQGQVTDIPVSAIFYQQLTSDPRVISTDDRNPFTIVVIHNASQLSREINLTQNRTEEFDFGPGHSADLGGIHLSRNVIHPHIGSQIDVVFGLQTPASVTLKIHGRDGWVKRLAEGDYPVGTHVLTWDGRNDGGDPVASGIYFLIGTIGDTKVKEKLAVVR